MCPETKDIIDLLAGIRARRLQARQNAQKS